MISILHDFENSLTGRKVFVTGHTGFTGGWACLWLQSIGVNVSGYALEPDTQPNLFNALSLGQKIQSEFADICDYERLLNSIKECEPDLVLHLAAQPLVRRSYHEPLRTFLVNTQGTANVLEAARSVKTVKGILCITTDKVYRNNEWSWAYRENDPLGGKDPYSASKAAAEMIIQGYAASYSGSKRQGPFVAIARGGNIIGGGDWSQDRLIPDFIRAIVNESPMTLRYPSAKRPWQHVLSLVYGYLMILAGLLSENPDFYARAWNFGPQDTKHYTVQDVLDLMSEYWKRPVLKYMNNPLPEAQELALDSSLAHNQLHWVSAWDTKRTIRETATWYRNYYDALDSACAITIDQIGEWRRCLV